MKCPACNAEMLPILTSVYCPNGCEKRETFHQHQEAGTLQSLIGRYVQYKKHIFIVDYIDENEDVHFFTTEYGEVFEPCESAPWHSEDLKVENIDQEYFLLPIDWQPNQPEAV